jgi:hypothetical protein
MLERYFNARFSQRYVSNTVWMLERDPIPPRDSRSASIT